MRVRVDFGFSELIIRLAVTYDVEVYAAIWLKMLYACLLRHILLRHAVFYVGGFGVL